MGDEDVDVAVEVVVDVWLERRGLAGAVGPDYTGVEAVEVGLGEVALGRGCRVGGDAEWR